MIEEIQTIMKRISDVIDSCNKEEAEELGLSIDEYLNGSHTSIAHCLANATKNENKNEKKLTHGYKSFERVDNNC